MDNLSKKNNAVVDEIKSYWDCESYEAWATIVFNTKTLQETQEAISKAITYKRLLASFFPAAVDYLCEKYERKDTSELILLEAERMAEDQATMIVDDWQQIDDYNEISEAEIITFLMGM